MGVLATSLPSIPVTQSNKYKAESGFCARPWQRVEASGLVAGLFWLAAHALFDPEDYWLKASRASFFFPPIILAAT